MVASGASRGGGLPSFIGSGLPLVIAVAAGLVVLGAMPRVLDAYPLIVVSYALVYAIACMSLNLLLGMTGLLSLGHAAFFGAGAYAGALLYSFGMITSFEAYVAAGVTAAAMLAIVFGFFCVHASKMHFAILTLAVSQLVHAVFMNGAIYRLFGPEGHALYLSSGGSLYIDRLTVLGEKWSVAAFIPSFYYVIVLGFLITLLVLWRLGRSPFGLALQAIRDNELRARYIGIPVWRYRWYAFIISGALTGLAGALFGQLNRQVTVEQLHWMFSAVLVVATVLGGMRQFFGPVVGACIFLAIDEFALHWVGARNIVFGVLLILVVTSFPRGAMGVAEGLAARSRLRRRE